MIREKEYVCPPNFEDVLIYDIETAAFGDSPNAQKDDLRVFGYYSFNTDILGTLPYYDKEGIQKLIDEHKFLVGYNNIEYDNPILEREGISLEYKRMVDLMKILLNRAGGMKTNKGMVGQELMRYSLDAVTRFFDLVNDDTAKGDLDYSILKKTKWTKEEKADIIKYTKRDIEITKKLYLFMEKYFEGFKDFVPEKDIKGKYYLTDSMAKVVYKAICHALKWEPEYDKDFTPVLAKDRIDGGYVSYPAGEKFVGNIYCLDYNSLYPSIMMMCNLYGRNKTTFKGWNGDNYFDVKGFYDSENQSETSVLLQNLYLLRMMYKRKLLLEDGHIIKMIDKKNGKSVYDYIGQKYHHVSKHADGQIRSSLELLTKAQADHFYKITLEGMDPREYTIKIIINCFDETGQIMTPEGIKYIKDCKVGDMVYSINPKNSLLEVKPIIDVTKREYTGSFHNYRSNGYNFRITPNHKLLLNNKYPKQGDSVFLKSVSLRDQRIIPSAKPNFPEQPEFIYLDDVYHENFMVAIRPKENAQLFFKDNNLDSNDFIYSKALNSYIINYSEIKKTLRTLENCDIKCYHKDMTIRDCNAMDYKMDRKTFMELIGWLIFRGNIHNVKAYTTINPRTLKVKKVAERKFVTIKGTHSWSEAITVKAISDLCKSLGLYPVKQGKIILCHNQILVNMMLPYKVDDTLMNLDSFLKYLDAETAHLIIKTMIKFSQENSSTDICVWDEGAKIAVCKLITLAGGTFVLTPKKNFTRIRTSFVPTLIGPKNKKSYPHNGPIYNVHVKDNHTIMAGSYGKFNWIGQTSYGILDKKYYKLVYDKVAAGDCTRLARQWVKLARKMFKAEGYKIIYTDSVTKDMKVTLQNDEQITVEEYWNKYAANKELVAETKFRHEDKEYGDCIKPILTCNDLYKNEFQTPVQIIRHKKADRIYEFHTESGKVLKCTADHSIITLDLDTMQYKTITPEEAKEIGFLLIDVKTHGLAPDDMTLEEADFTMDAIVSTEEYFENDYVYDFAIDDYEKFYANDVLVHNTDSWYFEDVYDDPQRFLELKDKLIAEIKKHTPFPSATFDAGVDDEIKAMFFFQAGKGKAAKEEDESELDDDDRIHKPLGLMKKNYIYVTQKDKLVLKNLGIKKKNISALSKKIFWEYMVPIIKKDFVVKFSKVKIDNLMIEYLSENIELAYMRKKVKSYGAYKKSNTIIQAQIAKKYGPGIHFLIPNKRHIGVGKGVTYCSDKEFKETGMSIADIDLEYYRKELAYFAVDNRQQKLFDMF